MNVPPFRERPAWALLQQHCQTVRSRHLRRDFADDPKRGERMVAEGAGVFLDYSKNRITDETVSLLLRLAEESGLRAHVEAMFTGRREKALDTQ